MTKEVSALVNSPVIWGIALVTMSVVIFLAVNYLIKTIKVSKELGITGEQVRIAVKTSCLASIGPSLVIMFGMISLLIVVGAPVALMRLSVVGNVSFELMCAGLAAEAFETPLSMETMTPEIFQTTVFVMAVGCIGYMLIPVFFINSFDKILEKMSGKEKSVKRATMISTAAILGCYGYVQAPYLVARNASTVAMVTGGIVMLLLLKVQKKTGKKWLLEWGMLISMVVGMLAGAVV